MFKAYRILLRRLHRNLVLTGLLCLATALPAHADLAQPYERDDHLIDASIGYRGVSTDDASERVGEYDSLISSPTFDLVYRGSCSYSENFVDIHYLNEKDYYLETDFNIRSRVRVRFLNERLYHALDHLSYETRPTAIFTNPETEETVQTDYQDQNPGDNHHIQIDQTEVSVRHKIPDYPAHASVKYWRWEKKGSRQLRFVDESCTGCHMQSRTLQIDQVTEEVTASVDAHLGFVDLIFEQIIRTFRNKAETPTDSFGDLSAGPFFTLRSAGEYQHDDTPDSRFTQSTLKAHTTLGGGFVANASVALGQRESNASLSDVNFDKAETDFRKLSSDITYIPSSHWTLNLRYRGLDLDQDNPATIENSAATSSTTDVRNSIDIERDYYAASLSYRPSPKLTLKGNYHREDIHRSNTNGLDNDVDEMEWELPEDETIQKMRMTVSSRFLPRNALKLQGWYEYQTSDSPAYANSLENGHTLFFSGIYRHNPLWGGTISARFKNIKNSDYSNGLFGEAVERDRCQNQHHASLGLWITPREDLTFDVNYGYFATNIDQDLQYGQEDLITGKSDLNQTVHTLSAGINWQVSQPVSCRLEVYQTRSEAEFSPDSSIDDLLSLDVATASDLEEISRIDLLQHGVKGRINWQINNEWSAGLEMALDDYDDKESDQFDGTVETCTVNIARSW